MHNSMFDACGPQYLRIVIEMCWLDCFLYDMSCLMMPNVTALLYNSSTTVLYGLQFSCARAECGRVSGCRDLVQ
jgi:hypothetical protein